MCDEAHTCNRDAAHTVRTVVRTAESLTHTAEANGRPIAGPSADADRLGVAAFAALQAR